MHLIAYDERQRRFLSAQLVLGIGLAAAVVAGVVAFLIGRASAQPDAAPAGAGAHSTTVTAAAGKACSAAMSAAEHALADAKQIEQSISVQTTVMNDLAAGRISAGTAVDRGVPSLIVAARGSTQFDQDMQLYRSAATRCS